jgi:hypothetical protein
MTADDVHSVQEFVRREYQGFCRLSVSDAAVSSSTTRVRMVRFLTAGELHGRGLLIGMRRGRSAR